MKKLMCVLVIFLIVENYGFAQSYEQETAETYASKTYLGVGSGFDYGGIIGGKIEYLPVKNWGVFAGLGYNLLSAGVNFGATYKILPEKMVSPNLMIFYGYNAVLKIAGISEYNATSYGLTIGGNVDIKFRNGSKISAGLFVPIRSSKFTDKYNAAKNNSSVDLTTELIPLGISLGYNFAL